MCEIDLILGNQVLFHSHVQGIRLALTADTFGVCIDSDSGEVLKHIIRISILTCELIFIELVVSVLEFLLVSQIHISLCNQVLHLLLPPSFLILSQSSEEQAIFVFLLSILDHLGELMRHNVSYTL